ncbi:hypothetical protein CTI12_AA468600 [Artemisia annua]|uniref:Uncharacterized protein n=1 Tax=Artemisia annua TaxID=35608 RepID=A0A2U1LPC6_ARTAN|nr:hypothetical protein CTI12_AA468600 [Artemisia annua]
MQRYKLAAARRTQKHMNVSFDRIVEIMKKKDEMRIRACYHKLIDMSGDSLIWMMAVDMAFLLEFLLNQIPLFLVRTMLEHQYSDTNKSADETLKSMLMGLYRELSPFQEVELPDVSIDDCDHLLDFLYHMTVPNKKELHIEETNIDVVEYEGITEEGGDGADQEESFAKPSDLRRFIDFMWKVVQKSNAGLIKILKMIIFGKFMAILVKLPWKIIAALPILKLMKEPIEEMLQNFRGEGGDKSKDDADDSKAPLIEEITIPSVTEMAKAGILFSPVNGGISEIDFNNKTSTLSLPVINLDINTEVYLRNLVAYEACVAAGPLVVARYTELMNGIIDTEEDAKFSRESGIVLNHLKSDKEVADLWNGMSKSVKLTKVPKMDKVIEDVNRRYGKTWRVKLSKFMKRYVFGSWRILTLLAALFILFLSCVQAFCSVYECARILHQLPEIPANEGAAE